MNTFLKLYRWGIGIKLYLSIYTLGLLFFKCLYELLMGSSSVPVLAIFEMIVVAFLLSLLQWFCFPPHRDLAKRALFGRTAVWAVGSNLFIVGGTLLFGWFSEVPLWGGAVLIVILEIGLAALWLAVYLAQQMDTKHLNSRLKAYQQQ